MKTLIQVGLRISRLLGGTGGDRFEVEGVSGANDFESLLIGSHIAPTAMVARLARRRLRARLWKGTRKCIHRCPPAQVPTWHRSLDLDQCAHWQQKFARRRRSLLLSAARLSQDGMVKEARVVLDEVNGWRDDLDGMCKQAKIVCATFF